MRVSNWNPQKYDNEFENAAMDRLKKAAEVVADKTRANLRSIIQHDVSRPAYKKGPYKDSPWTARVAGAMLKTVRVVEKKDQSGALIASFRNIRVYVGNDLVYYAKMFEYAVSRKRGQAFLRPALNQSKNEIRSILENG